MIDRNEMDNRTYIPTFDGVRAIAIVAIIAHQLFAYRIQGGFLGVNIFLVLSGYFMTSSLMTSLMTRGKVPLRTFLVRRLSCIIQPMLAMMGVVLLFVMVFQRELLSNLRSSVVSSFFFVNNWWQIFQDTGGVTSILTQSPFAHLWVISLVFQYYLLWPIVFVFLSVMCRKPSQLVRVVGILTVVSAIVMLVVYQLQPSTLRVLLGTDTRACSVFIGGGVALLYPIDRLTRESRWQHRYEPVLRVVPVIVMVVMLIFMKAASAWTYRGGMLLFDLILAAVIMLSLHSRSVVSIVFRLKPLTWIGRRSLMYFLWYWPVYVLYQASISDTSVNAWVHLLVMFVLIVVIGEVWFQLFEKNQTKTFLQRIIMLFPEKTRPTVRPALLIGVVVLMMLGFFQASPRLSAQEAALQQTIHDNETLANNTQTTNKQVIRTINNIAGLTREETVYSSNSAITFIGDATLYAMAQELPTIYPNAVISGATDLELYEMTPLINRLVANHHIGDIIVLMIGANSSFSRGQLDHVLRTIGMDKQIFLVTSTVNRTWQTHVNTVMTEMANQYSNVHLLDWKREAAAHPDWFYEGSAYVNTTGANGQALWMAKNIYQALRG